MNYTKGEWEIRGNDIIFAGSGAKIAQVDNGWPKAEIAYHANLISAAPAMYEVLKTIKRIFDHGMSDTWHVAPDSKDPTISLGDIIDKALAKAEGK